MTEEQLEIAQRAVADVVFKAAPAQPRPSAQELKELAEDAAKAIVAGWQVLNEVAGQLP